MSLRVTFLGTGGALPTTERAPSALFVNREGDGLLFDCGEGTQRQMMRFGTGFDVSHVFVTHLHGDHVLGLPGLVQSWDFNGRDEALAVHVPAGTRKHARDLVHAGGFEPEYPVRINEVTPGAVALEADEYEVRTFETDHRTRSMGFALVEDDRPGRFDREKAEQELGIEPGPKYGKLHAGDPVELEDGQVIHSEQVVGPPRPGRRLAYTGDTRPIPATVEAARNADLLIHDATFDGDLEGRARKTAHSTGAEAAEIAVEAGARRLALVHVSSRYAGDPSPIEEEARAVFGEGDEGNDEGTDDGRGAADRACFVPDDGRSMEVPFPDS